MKSTHLVIYLLPCGSPIQHFSPDCLVPPNHPLDTRVNTSRSMITRRRQKSDWVSHEPAKCIYTRVAEGNSRKQWRHASRETAKTNDQNKGTGVPRRIIVTCQTLYPVTKKSFEWVDSKECVDVVARKSLLRWDTRISVRNWRFPSRIATAAAIPRVSRVSTERHLNEILNEILKISLSHMRLVSSDD